MSPTNRRADAQHALTSPPGPPRQRAIDAYLREHGAGFRPTWTLVCEAVQQTNLDDPSSAPSLVADLRTSIPSRALGDLLEHALDNPVSKLKDPRARRRARALRLEADRAVAIDDLDEADAALCYAHGTASDPFRRVALLRAHTDLAAPGVATSLGLDEDAVRGALHRAYVLGQISVADLRVIAEVSEAIPTGFARRFIDGTSTVELPVAPAGAITSDVESLKAPALRAVARV
jgi:hypothetical protein